MVVVGLLAAWDLYTIRRELDDGRRALDELTLQLAATDGLTGVATDAAQHLERAADVADGSSALGALGLLPVVDDQITGIRRMTDATADLGASAVQAATRLDRELDRAGEPAGRVALLDVAMQEIDRIDSELAEVDLGSPRGLMGPLRGAHDDLVGSIGRARTKLAEGRDLVAPVREMLVGPSTYLLLAANNAEMAGGAGLALSAGPLTFAEGDIELGDVIPAGDLRLESSVPVPPELQAIYSPTGIGVDFRSSTRSPNLPAMGPVIADMVAARGVEIDGVIVVDALALEALLEITGGVDVRGEAIDAENVLREVLNENYKQFESAEDRPERVSLQGEIAKAVFDAVTERDVRAAELADALLESSKGRHLMLWSAEPGLQDVWDELAVSGALSEHGLMISFQNYAANKLDWYLRPESALDVGLTPNGDYRARLTMTMRTPALADLDDASPYILGPNPELQGLFLTAHLPAAAYDITTPDQPGFRTKGMDGPLQARTFLVDVPMGTTVERTIEFTMPRELPGLVLLPSARVEPMPLTVDGSTTVTDARPTFVSWAAANPGSAGDDGVRMPVRALVLLGITLTLLAASASTGSLLRAAGGAPRTGWLRVARGAAVTALLAFVAAGLVAVLLSVPRV